MTTFGCARVSTDGQELDSQLDALKAAGAVKVFKEKESGIKTDRKELPRAIAALDKGDMLLVSRLDRLARSTLDLLNTLEQISKRKAGFRSLADTWADTTTPHGKLMITILGGLAEFERTLILSRTNEGRQRARANGVKFGRKPKLTQYQIDEATKRLEAGKSQARPAARASRGKPNYFRHEIMVESRVELDHEAVLHYLFCLWRDLQGCRVGNGHRLARSKELLSLWSHAGKLVRR
jgi:DNA invertase Pin-like site-specific DNA recombinase